MRSKKTVLLLAALLSLPLCLLPIITWTGLLVPWLVVGLTVENQSGETLFITPVKQSAQPPTVIIPTRYSFGQLRAFRQADLRLAPGQSIQLLYDLEGALPTDLAIRTEAGQYRQLGLDRGANGATSGEPAIVYVITSFETLPDIDQAVLSAATQANRFHVDFNFWGSTLLCTGAGMIPIGLLAIWFRLKL